MVEILTRCAWEDRQLSSDAYVCRADHMELQADKCVILSTAVLVREEL